MVQITIKDITRGAETIDIDGEQGDELQRIFQKDFGKSLESTQGLQYVTFKKKEILLYGGRELSQDFKDIVLPIFHEKLEMRARREREEKARASARAGGGGGGGSGGGGEGGESAAGEVLFPDGESFVRYMKERVREEVDESVLLELDRRYTKEKLFKDLLESVINRIQRHPNSGITPDILMAIKEISYEGLEGNLGMIKDFVDQANRHASRRASETRRVPAGGGGGGGSGGGGEGGDLESEMVRIKIVNYSNTKINSIKIPLKILDQFREEHGVDLQDKDCNLVEVMLKGGKGRVKETHFFFDGKEIENRAIRDALYEAVKQEESIKPRVYPFSSDPALKDDVALKKAIKKQSERSRHRFECTWNSITIFEACLNVIDLFDKEKISENLKKRLEKRRGQTLHIRLYDSDGEFYIDGEIPVFKNAESKNIFKNMLYLEAINYPGRDFRSSMIDPEYLDRVNRIKAELAAEASRGRGEDAAAEAAPARRSSAPRVPAGGGGGGGSGGGGEDVSSALEWDAESLFKAIDERLVTKVNDSVELGVPREMAFEDARNSLIKDVFYEDQRRFGDVPYDIAEAILDVKESNVKDLKTRIRARAHGRSMWAVGANVGGDHRAAAAPGRDGGRGRG